LKRIAFAILLLIGSISCDSGETKQKNQNEIQTNFLITIVKFREEGNCKKSVTNSSITDRTVTCNRKPRGFCNINQSLVTQGEVTYLLSEAKKVRDRNSDCETSFLQSGILLTTATSSTDEERIRSKHEYITVTSCEEDGFVINSVTRLASFEEFKFLDTARGKIGRTAKTLSLSPLTTVSIRDKAKLCLEKEFIESERSFFTDLVAGKIITEISK
jgi:hypothetical protein